MDKFMIIMEELFVADEDNIDIHTHLKEIKTWDSLSMVNFVAMADVEYNKMLGFEAVLAAETVGDLYELVRS